MSFGYPSSPGIHGSNEFTVNDGRDSLSLAIPGDNAAFTKDIFQFDESFDTTPSQLFDMNSLNSLNPYLSPDSLVPRASMQRPSRQMGHNRGLSVAGTSWTPAASPSLTSPSLSFTPFRIQLLWRPPPPTPYGHEDFSILGRVQPSRDDTPQLRTAALLPAVVPLTRAWEVVVPPLHGAPLPTPPLALRAAQAIHSPPTKCGNRTTTSQCQ
ncbi:hypothetical protein FA13DRAFT_1185441 [Coprinellus micaceus]|uniref:Uncharacterized protein n=1 Tax=Coprinellus micaceus TaxID=71717 RepID=A0A4Y7STE0_COPMI|nr:hypothetical protein FA13DRAFT_1185441 [Coprinellus micaceus]